MAAFEEKYDEEFGVGISLNAQNLVDTRKFEVRLPDVVIQVKNGKIRSCEEQAHPMSVDEVDW